jgi:hypothetical protein
VESSVDATEVVIRLYETIRTFIIAYSGVPGGDGRSAFIHIKNGAFPDLAANRNEPDNETVHQLTEFPDNVGPTFKQASIDYGTGTFILEAHKTMDLTPASQVNTSRLYFANLVDDPIENGMLLTGADIVTLDGMVLTMYLLEHQKVFAHNLSNTPGAGYSGSTGDGESTFFGLVLGAILDTATNPANNTRGIPLIETPDTIRGKVLSIRLLYSTGTLLVTANETVDTTPTSLVILENITLANNSMDNAISIVGSNVIAIDTPVLTIILTEKQRVAAIALSGTPGGDGNAVFFDMHDASLRDRSGNFMFEKFGVVVSEVADTILPSVVSTVLDLTTGIVIISTSETIDITPSSLVTLSSFTFESSEVAGDTIQLASATIKAVDDVAITLLLPESTRVEALINSNTPGGDGVPMAIEIQANAYRDIAENKNLQDPAAQNTLNELADIGKPNITGARIR